MQRQSLNDDPLWMAIQTFEIYKPPCLVSFVKRLRQEHYWSADFAGRVEAEYRRFLYLSVAAGHPCVPSEAVAHAWNLHRSTFESYFERLCDGVLKTHLIPEQESVDRQHQYELTLLSYQRVFDSTPDPAVWPSGAAYHEEVSIPKRSRFNPWGRLMEEQQRATKIQICSGVLGTAVGICIIVYGHPQKGLVVGATLVLAGIGVATVIQRTRSGSDSQAFGIGEPGGNCSEGDAAGAD